MMQKDSVISSPSTPSSSLSSQSNLNTSISNSAVQPTIPSTAPLNITINPYHNNTLAQSPAGVLAHKNSLRGTKLARRARSFKDDLFEKISLMRTPTNTLGRSQSPQSPRNNKNKQPPTAEEMAKSVQSLDTHVKDISNALKHFRDVILKKKLEVLPGNGTVILETIASMFSVIQSYMLNENSATLRSATQLVYQSLGKLIKLCDEVMLSDENEECASLSSENVKEIVDLLEDAVRNLALLAQQKLKEKEELAFQYENVPIPLDESLHPAMVDGTIAQNLLARPPVEIAGQRTSLPDINLTPKERENLENTNNNPMRVSYSTESILRDTSPPPKPPLPNRSSNPPPLPPKKNSQSQQQQHQQQEQQQPYNKVSLNANLDIGMEYPLDADRLSVRSHSPDENSSQCSLDSAMNHLRDDDDECRLFSCDYNILHDEFKNRKDVVDSGSKINKKYNAVKIEKLIGSKEMSLMQNANANTTGTSICTNTNTNINIAITTTTLVTTASTTETMTTTTTTTTTGMTIGDEDCTNNKAELRRNVNDQHHRHSNESGFVSINSFRTSSQSYSKRSSDFSFQSSNKSSNSSTEITFTTSDNNNVNEEEHNIKTIAATAATSATIATTTISSSSSLVTAKLDGNSIITKNKNFHQNSEEEYFEMFPVDVEKTLIDQFENTLKILQQNNNNNNNNNNDNNNSSTQQEEATALQLCNVITTNHQLLNDENNINISNDDDDDDANDHLMPPALPPKIKNHKDRQPSMYDNYDALDNINDSVQELPEMRQHHHQHRVYQWQTKHSSLIDPRRLDLPSSIGSCQTIRLSCDDNNQPCEQPPPLPMKKKHILAYMEICSASTRSIEQHRHTMHAYNLSRNISHSQTMNIVPLAKEEFLSPEVETPPALPPKNYKQRRVSGATAPPTIITTPPPSPKPKTSLDHTRVLGSTASNDLMSTVCEEIIDQFDEDSVNIGLKQNNYEMSNAKYPSSHNVVASPCNIAMAAAATDIEEDIVNYNNNNHNFDDSRKSPSITEEINHLPNIIEEIEITPYLIFKKENEDGPEVKGGYIDALIVHASRVQKITDNAFSEAFITTFRTFIHPIDVIEKLTHRYTVFFCQHNDQKQKAAKETFSLLVRVVNDLTSTDLTTSSLLTLLMEFVYQLVCAGQLYLAKLLRNKIVEKVTLYRESRLPLYVVNDMLYTVTNQPSLLDLKSVEIAEQMTLLDAELFQKIEIPEVLLFAKEQCEEKSPNLNKFTEHFNKMSYWARSKILTLPCAKEREKHVIKFIKIMKHLRKMNNYNSYLALLSALDSAPIRRLEWHKSITESLKEYCTLIDSSSSFRAYRQALAETQPPCIPYIGLVLQDLTFVHVGNPDYLKDGFINFSKRWQQYNIIDNMKRFKKCSYPFRRNERIIRFFENFENFLGEEQMWEISETIKPRGKRTVVHN